MILGIGLDLCAIDRISRAIEKQHFLDRVYTQVEQTRIETASDIRRAEIAAGLFAAKEAAAKALGTGFSDFFTSDIEIAPDASGRPVCTLYGGALKRVQMLCDSADWHIWVSITHEMGIAAATAILEMV